ncbi:MAG: ATP synthase F1 subunit delta [Fimbriimonadaceae bacterium]
MDSKVAKRYARALFNSAKKSGMIESVESDLNAIAQLSETHAEFRGFLESPRIGRDDKIMIAEKLFSDRITSLSMGMLRLMLIKRREMEFAGMRNEYILLRRVEGHVLHATVTSARDLEPNQQTSIVAKLEEKSGKKVEAEFRVDASLIGGVRVAIGNHVLDGSVRGTMNRLRDRLKYDLLKQN